MSTEIPQSWKLSEIPMKIRLSSINNVARTQNLVISAADFTPISQAKVLAIPLGCISCQMVVYTANCIM